MWWQLAIVAGIVVCPWLVPWGRNLLLLSLALWFGLWGMLFGFLQRAHELNDRFGPELLLMLLIVLYSISCLLRMLQHWLWMRWRRYRQQRQLA